MKKEVTNVRFGCWVPPMPDGNYGVPGSFITVERYQEARDMGLDFVIGHMEKGPDDPNVKAALDCSEATGLKYILRWEGMIDYAESTPEELKKALGYTLDHPALMGVLIRDEPNAKEFPRMGKIAALYHGITDKYFYLNLFPWDAGAELLGAPTYADHLKELEKYVKNDMLSMDIYPLRKKPGGVYYVSDCFLRNLEEVQNFCKKHDMEHWQFIQGSMAYGISKAPDYFDMRFQIYCSLCYGAIALQYYCYCTPNLPAIIKKKRWTSMLDYYGNKTKRYFAAQRLNAEVHGMGGEFMTFVPYWKGVMPIIGTKNEKGENPAFSMLETALDKAEGMSAKAEQDTIIGVFERPDGKKAYMIVNYTVPAYRIKDKVELDFKGADKAEVYVRGKKRTAKLAGGKLTLELGAGEGVFVIV